MEIVYKRCISKKRGANNSDYFLLLEHHFRPVALCIATQSQAQKIGLEIHKVGFSEWLLS
jgi:hypothetical protein